MSFASTIKINQNQNTWFFFNRTHQSKKAYKTAVTLPKKNQSFNCGNLLYRINWGSPAYNAILNAKHLYRIIRYLILTILINGTKFFFNVQ